MQLVAVLANPAMPDHGHRTRARVELAAEIIGCAGVEIVNLLDVPSRSSQSLQMLGRDLEPWLSARSLLAAQLQYGDEVLLGYGLSSPSGPAREHYRAQVEWVQAMLSISGLRPWLVGGQPRHPSRWQRHTVRAFPGVEFKTALAIALAQVI